jgi:hypothetical protein
MKKYKINILKLSIVVVVTLLSCSKVMFAQVSVTLPTITKQYKSVPEWIDVTVGSLTGQNITAFQFSLTYNKNVIFIDSAMVGPVASGGLFAFNADTANQIIKVAFATAYPLSGFGTLLKLKVHYLNKGSAKLAFDSTFKFNAGIPHALVNEGSIRLTNMALLKSDSAKVGNK